VRDGRGLLRIDGCQQVRVGDVELELFAVDLALVVRGSDRQRIERLVRDLESGHGRDRNTRPQPRRNSRTTRAQRARMPTPTPPTGLTAAGAGSGSRSSSDAMFAANCFVI